MKDYSVGGALFQNFSPQLSQIYNFVKILVLKVKFCLILGGKFDDDLRQEKNIKDTAEKLIQDMATRLNYNGNMILDHFTLGKRPLPVDGRPKIGRLINQKGEKLNGIYLAVMHSGITNAPLAG